MIAWVIWMSAITLLAASNNSKHTQLAVQIEVFNNCPKTNYSVRLINSRVLQTNRSTFRIWSEISIRETLYEPKGRISFKKCDTRTNKNNCEYMMKLDIGNLCEKLEEEGQPWSGISQRIHPKLKCPIEQGNYILQNGSLDAGIIEKITPEGFIWLYEFEIYGIHNEIYFCNIGEYTIQKLKKCSVDTFI